MSGRDVNAAIKAVPDLPPDPGPDLGGADGLFAALPRRGRRTSGRSRHDEKITVYVDAGELHDLDLARIVLNRDHGLKVDRGRVVREAVAMLLADFDERGADSVLVRRLRAQ